jgi:hypothetical protein
MSSLKILLGVSLAANLVLVAVWVRQSPATAHTSTEVSSEQAVATSLEASFSAREGDTHGLGAIGAGVEPQHALAELQSDVGRTVRQLQAAGFPRRMIIDVAQYLAQRASSLSHPGLMLPAEGAQAYWKVAASESDPSHWREQSRLTRELEATLKAALGPDYLLEKEETLERLHAQYGPLPPEKLLRVLALRQDYDELRNEAIAESGGSGSMVQEKMQSIEKAFRAELAESLTPQELFEHDVRSSETARHLRDKFQLVELTESEFRTLFTLYQTLDQQYPSAFPGAAMRSPAQREAEVRLLEQAKAALGAERAAELAQASDPRASRENRLVARLGLPLSKAAELTGLRSEVSQQVMRIQRDSTLSAEERVQRIAALMNDAEQKLTGLLGPRGLSAYREYGGEWMEQLRQPRSGR